MSQKRKDIQGVRAWAIVLVLLFHFFPSIFPNGYVGVDMFFVISGFLMAMIISKNEDIGVSTFKSFYYRRIKRILPLYYLVILFILLVVVLFLPPSFRSLNLLSSRKAVFLVSNIRETEDANQRYNNMLVQAEDLFTHTWSLSVEMQWYMLVPFIYVIQRLLITNEIVFFSGMAATSLILYFCTELDAAFYSVFARMWQFSFGILAFTWDQSKNIAVDVQESGPTETEENRQLLDGAVAAKNLEKSFVTAPKPKRLLNWCVLVLTLAIPLLVIPLPARTLRVEITFATAALIYLGKNYQNIILTKAEVVFLGDISYALYLFHWPVHVVINYYYSGNPLGPFFGICVSGFLAAATYCYYEQVYLCWSPKRIGSLTLALLCCCAFLCLQSEHVDDFDVNKSSIDLSKVNVRDAAWNMTLMRYLIAEGNHPFQDMIDNNCTYSNRFLNKSFMPMGFCSMKKGNGKYNFLVLGNSFACNQGGVVYNAFRNHANEFNRFCLPDCEAWVATNSWCQSVVNYTSIIEELKPDIVFLINRHMKAKEPYDVRKSLSEDLIYRNQTIFVKYLEAAVKKVYIVQALPRCHSGCPNKALKHTENGHPLNTIKDGLIVKDEFFARQRTWDIGQRCKKCQIVDYLPVLVDNKGQFLGYDPETNLMYFDVHNHFNNVAKERIQIIFDMLAKEFSSFENIQELH